MSDCEIFEVLNLKMDKISFLNTTSQYTLKLFKSVGSITGSMISAKQVRLVESNVDIDNCIFHNTYGVDFSL